MPLFNKKTYEDSSSTSTIERRQSAILAPTLTTTTAITKSQRSSASTDLALKSTFTKDADTAFEEFCQKYLNSASGVFMNFDNSANSNPISSSNYRSNSLSVKNSSSSNSHLHLSFSMNDLKEKKAAATIIKTNPSNKKIVKSTTKTSKQQQSIAKDSSYSKLTSLDNLIDRLVETTLLADAKQHNGLHLSASFKSDMIEKKQLSSSISPSKSQSKSSSTVEGRSSNLAPSRFSTTTQQQIKTESVRKSVQANSQTNNMPELSQPSNNNNKNNSSKSAVSEIKPLVLKKLTPSGSEISGNKTTTATTSTTTTTNTYTKQSQPAQTTEKTVRKQINLDVLLDELLKDVKTIEPPKSFESTQLSSPLTSLWSQQEVSKRRRSRSPAIEAVFVPASVSILEAKAANETSKQDQVAKSEQPDLEKTGSSPSILITNEKKEEKEKLRQRSQTSLQASSEENSGKQQPAGDDYQSKNVSFKNEFVHNHVAAKSSPFLLVGEDFLADGEGEEQQKSKREAAENEKTKGEVAADKPEGWLGLKVYACGLSKTSQLPVPKNNFFIEKGNFGDDAAFWSENARGDAIGIADGATGNKHLGFDPGDFSRMLMKMCAEIFTEEKTVTDAKDLILKAYEETQNTSAYGSCTSCVLTLDHRNNRLTAANVGDSGYCILRNGIIIHRSEPQRITFDCPRQLDSYPWKEKSRQMGVSYTNILANETDLDVIDIKKDDIIVVSSDGLYDNVDFEEIEEITQKSKTVMDTAHNLVYRALKNYYKPDDIIVLVAKVVDDKQSGIQQKFSVAVIDQN